MKTFLITMGPIPGKLDSVKYITNRFKGGLMAKVASKLSENPDFKIDVIKWKHTDIKLDNVNIIDVDDVYDYVNKVLENEYDVYVMGAAVANLIPKNPFEGKFPSHNYKVGDTISIDFEIAPRAIDEIKKKYPKSTLIAYKLFDSSDEELVKAGWLTLIESKANAVFCNHPNWAKDRKIMLTPDGAQTHLTFDEHIDMISRMANLEWYRTVLRKEVIRDKPDIKLDIKLELLKISKEWMGYSFGCVAIRNMNGFLTTTRGKKGSGIVHVFGVDHERRIVYSEGIVKATLNAPLLHKLFRKYPNVNKIIHGHGVIDAPTIDYLFPGTTDENKALDLNEMNFNIKGHGYYKLI